MDKSLKKIVEAIKRIDEAGLSIDDILKKGDEIKAQRDKEAADEKAAKTKQNIKSIWVKDFKFGQDKDTKDYAILEITYMDGSKEEIKFDVSAQNNKDFIQSDQLFKELKKAVDSNFKKKGIKPSEEDYRLSLVRVAFNDWRIKWYYGKDKKTDSIWAFAKELPKAASTSVAKKARANNNAVDDGVIIYKSGNTTIKKMR